MYVLPLQNISRLRRFSSLLEFKYRFRRPPLRSAFHDKTALTEVPNILRSTSRKKKNFLGFSISMLDVALMTLSHSRCRHVGIIDGKKLKSAKVGWRLMASGSLKVSWKSVYRYTG